MHVASGKFSVLRPGAAIAPHVGPSNNRLKLHLGLIVPPISEAYMTIAGHRRGWREGKCNILDDSFEHWVVHKGPEDRVILDIVVEHPDIKAKIKKHSRLGPVNDPSWIGFWGPGAGEAARSEL